MSIGRASDAGTPEKPPGPGEVIRFRDYQPSPHDRAIAALEQGRHALIDYPTGAGKTTITVGILASLDRRKFSHRLVIVPQRQTEDGFAADPPARIEFPEGSNRVPIRLPAGFLRQARHADERLSSEAILAYLAEKKPAHALVTTHGAIGHLFRSLEKDDALDRLPASLKKCVLVVDECHHVSPANRLGMVVDLWSGRGGRLLYLTATPYSGDGRVVVREGMEVIRRTIPEHIEGGLHSPSRIEHRVIPFGSAEEEVNQAQFLGSELTSNLAVVRSLAKAMVARWEEEGRPKLIIQVPPLRGGSAPLIEVLLAEFRESKAFAYNSSGEGTKTQAKFLDILRDEKARLRDGREPGVDVIVGCGRVGESTDWPCCSSVFRVGIPGSLMALVQLLGRATRKKPDYYPERHRDVASLTMFVPTGGGVDLEKLGRDCVRHALVMFTFLADCQLGESLIATRAIRRAIGGGGTGGTSGGGVPIGGDETDGDDEATGGDGGASGLNGGDSDGDGGEGGSTGGDVSGFNLVDGLTPEDRAAVMLAMAARQAEGGPITVGVLIEAARGRVEGLSEESLEVVAYAILAANEATKAGVDRVGKQVGRSVDVKPDINRESKRIVAAVVEEFRDAELGEVASLALMAAQAFELDGKGIGEWAGRFDGPELYEFEGKKHTLGEWDAIRGFRNGTMRKRVIRSGMSIGDALAMPLKEATKYTHGNESHTLGEWDAIKGFRKGTMYSRVIAKGMSIGDALAMPLKEATKYTHGDESHTLREWDAIKGFRKGTMWGRVIKRGMSIGDALAMPMKEATKYTHGDESHTLGEWDAIRGFRNGTMRKRVIKRGMSIGDALAMPYKPKNKPPK